MDQNTKQLVIEQVIEAQSRHPALELRYRPHELLCVHGKVGFAIDHDLGTTTDCYSLAMGIPDEYPDSPPIVFETEKRIPDEFQHFMAAGNLCLGAPVEVKLKFAAHRNLLKFIDSQVIPYLYSYSHLRDYGNLPFGERQHGARGLLQYYTDFFEVEEIQTMQLLKYLAEGFTPPSMDCPCESGRQLKNCHGEKLALLGSQFPVQHFESELRDMIKFQQSICVKLPRGRVTPKRHRSKRFRSDKV